MIMTEARPNRATNDTPISLLDLLRIAHAVRSPAMTTLSGEPVGTYVERNYVRLTALAADPDDRRRRLAAQVLERFDEQGRPRPRPPTDLNSEDDHSADE